VATKKNQSKRANPQGWQQAELQFASRRLSREEAEQFVEWYKTQESDTETALLWAIGEGYKVGFKLDFNNSAMVVSFTMQDDRHPHYGVYLTSRSDDPIEAFFMNVFKVSVLYLKKAIETDDRLNDLWG